VQPSLVEGMHHRLGSHSLKSQRNTVTRGWYWASAGSDLGCKPLAQPIGSAVRLTLQTRLTGHIGGHSLSAWLFFTTALSVAVQYLLYTAAQANTHPAYLMRLAAVLQATVSPDSALIGHSARQMRFRTYYEGVVLAIHRQVCSSRCHCSHYWHAMQGTTMAYAWHGVTDSLSLEHIPSC